MASKQIESVEKPSTTETKVFVKRQQYIPFSVQQLRKELQTQIAADQRFEFNDFFDRLELIIMLSHKPLGKEVLADYNLFEPSGARLAKHVGNEGYRAAEDRFLTNCRQLLERANFEPLSKEMWDFALKANYVTTLPIEPDFDTLDGNLLGDYNKAHPNEGEAKLPDFVDKVWIYTRGMDVDQTSSKFVKEKIDILVQNLVTYAKNKYFTKKKPADAKDTKDASKSGGDKKEAKEGAKDGKKEGSSKEEQKKEKKDDDKQEDKDSDNTDKPKEEKPRKHSRSASKANKKEVNPEKESKKADSKEEAKEDGVATSPESTPKSKEEKRTRPRRDSRAVKGDGHKKHKHREKKSKKKVEEEVADPDVMVYERKSLKSQVGDITKMGHLFNEVTVQEPRFKEVVMLYRVKRKTPPLSKTKKKDPMANNDPQMNNIFLRAFRDIPMADVKVALPKCKTKLSALDFITIVVTLAIAVISLIVNLMTEAGGYVGLMSMVTFAGVAFKVYSSYNSLMILYEKTVLNLLTKKTINTNSGLLTWLIDEVQAQEWKEAVLGYFFLLLKVRSIFLLLFQTSCHPPSFWFFYNVYIT